MGGQAFASLRPPLPTPRMPPEIYDQVLKSAHALLHQHYSHVDSPIEAPGKSTYGDVDILLFGPLDASFDPAATHVLTVAENIAQLLGAKKWIRENTNLLNFAIPWPPQGNGDSDEKYIQLDIHICHSQKVFQWELFHKAHGDLWNILGSTIRRFGITVNNNGLFLRIPEIEAYDRKKSMVLLTDQPSEILEFLGLEEDDWWKPFKSREAMFEYAAGCRMFYVKEAKSDNELEGDVIVETGDTEGQEGGAEGKKKLKHNDRQRMEKRPIFKEWIDEFIPKCREEGRLGNTKVTREEIRDDAFEKFGVKENYETKKIDWVLIRHRDDLWREVIKGCVPEEVEPGLRAASIRTLKSVIMECEPFDGEVVLASQTDKAGFYDVEEVRKFVTNNWQRAGEIGWARQQARALETMKLKAAKKAEESNKKKVEVEEG